ncbi:hypothetical protein KFE25_007802 [Diacronema lutheri]|uniref:Uncharacterized protein n=1 Tax=Diacronema lutheri TaxID=2081491 RepID=A0A8J6CE43_DIALT|nr:hypothetical protein KFE25_007802 [Diacronema lutheri]
MARYSLIALVALVAGTHAFQAPAAPRALLSRVRAAQPSFVMAEERDVPMVKTKSGLGRTVDQDGKSNVWAVEPKMRVENKPMSMSDPKILAAVGALVLVAVGIPLFPTLFSGANGQY